MSGTATSARSPARDTTISSSRATAWCSPPPARRQKSAVHDVVWEATGAESDTVVDDWDYVFVTVLGPEITLDMTVMVDDGHETCGTESAIAVPAGTQVRYCYTMTDSGDEDVNYHFLDDDQLGSLINHLDREIAPGETLVHTEVAVITEAVTSTAEWAALSQGTGVDVSASDSVTVEIAAGEVDPTTTTDDRRRPGSVCRDPGPDDRAADGAAADRSADHRAADDRPDEHRRDDHDHDHNNDDDHHDDAAAVVHDDHRGLRHRVADDLDDAGRAGGVRPSNTGGGAVRRFGLDTGREPAGDRGVEHDAARRRRGPRSRRARRPDARRSAPMGGWTVRHRSVLVATCVGIVWVVAARGTSAGFTTPTTTTSPVIVLPTTTLRPSFTTTTSTTTTTTTTTTTSPVIVIPTTARSTTTTSPVIVIPSTTTTVPPTVVPTGPPNIAISTTSDAPDVAAELPEDFPDVSVRAIEVTQGIQDLESRMPLVAGRKTVVRVHVAAYDAGAGGSADVHIDGALLVERAGVEEVLYPMNGPIVPGLDRTNLDSALNFELDAADIAAGDVTLTAEVWAIAFEQSDEPDPANNLMSQHVEFHTAEVPTVMLMALDDGAGPGPAVGDVNSALLPFAVLVYQDLLDYMPIAAVDVQFYPVPVLPGAEAVEPGLWDLGLDADVDATANTRRNEPNTRMNGIAAAGGYLGESTVIGLIDDAVPTDVYSGWAKFEVSWAQANPGTPAHEVGHNQGLAHVGCVDNDGDGLGDEESGGAVDHTHPTGLPPQCSLAPIDPEGFFGYTTYHDPAIIYSNDPGHPQAAFPFMSYADPGWNDPYDWCLLLTSFGVPCSPAGLGLPAHPDPFTVIDCVPEPVGEFGMELCLAQGTADPLPAPAPTIDHLTNEVGMETLTIQVEGTTFEYPTDTEGWAYVSTTLLGDGSGGAIVLARSAAPDAASMGRQFVASGGDQVLRVVDAEGRILATVPVVTAEPGGGDVAGHAWPSHDGNQGAATGTPFAALSPVPLVEGAVAVEFVVEGIVVDSIPVAAAPPEIGAVSVATVDDEVLVSWEHGDSAGPEGTTYTVRWSADGETWIPVAVDVAGTEIRIPASAQLPGGDQIQVEVIANAGLRTATAVSEAFVAPSRAPSIAIAGAPPGPVPLGGSFELHAVAVDPEGADVDITWTLDGAEVAHGGVFVAAGDLDGALAVGVHTISAAVTDADGNRSTVDLPLEVVP